MAWLPLLQSALKALSCKEPAANAFNLCHAVIDVHYQSQDTSQAPASDIESPSSLSASWRDDMVVSMICGNCGNTIPATKKQIQPHSNNTFSMLWRMYDSEKWLSFVKSNIRGAFLARRTVGVRGYLEIQAHQQ